MEALMDVITMLFGWTAEVIAPWPLLPFRYGSIGLALIVGIAIAFGVGAFRWGVVGAIGALSVSYLGVGAYILMHPGDARWARGRGESLPPEELRALALEFFELSAIVGFVALVAFIIASIRSRQFREVSKHSLNAFQNNSAKQVVARQRPTVERRSAMPNKGAWG